MNVISQFIDQVNKWFANFMENLGSYLFILFEILIVIILCKIVLSLISNYTKRQMDKNSDSNDSHAKRSNSILTLVRSYARYGVYFVELAIILNLLGFGHVISGLLATAGIASLAIGFGAQSLVKDVVTGFFLIFENQFSVGDYININGVEGTVEAMAMRVTYLRARDGSQIIVPNGQILNVVNITRGNSVAKVIVKTKYSDNTAEIIELVKELVAEYANNNKELLIDEPSVLAISEFADSSVNFTIFAKTANLKHWQVERDLRLLIKTEFDARGIEIPYQTITINDKKK